MADFLKGIYGAQDTGGETLARITRTGLDLGFQEVLRTRLERETGVSFSSHVMNRLSERGVTLRNDEIVRLADAVDKAEAKGVTDSLIMLDDKAFIVSVRNRTVITALSGDAMRNNVFTNIDGAVIA
jgi:flagellar operon protein